MPIESGDYPTIEPTTTLGRALVAFFDVLEPVFASGDKGVFQVIVFGGCAIDVAISKLGRFGDRDMHDIQALLQLPHVDIGEFERLAREAISYGVGEQTRILENLKKGGIFLANDRD